MRAIRHPKFDIFLLLWAGWWAGTIQAWRMKPVVSIQARVEAYAPMWDKEHKAYVSAWGESFDDSYVAALDSVTTASIEGALMYLQSSCIDMGPFGTARKCQRANDVKYITFYEITMVQPNEALAEYGELRFNYPEYCPFVRLQNGKCVGDDDGDFKNKPPPECKQYNGQDGQPNIGPCVGAVSKAADSAAPYDDAIWFSYPGGCITKSWNEGKDAQCRKDNPGGLCAFGDKPDGVRCSFSYRILGYLNIDDLVGITSSPKEQLLNVSSNLTAAERQQFATDNALANANTSTNVNASAEGPTAVGSATSLPATTTPLPTSRQLLADDVATTDPTIVVDPVPSPLPSTTTLTATTTTTTTSTVASSSGSGSAGSGFSLLKSGYSFRDSFVDYKAFCQAGGLEFAVNGSKTEQILDQQVNAIPFWLKPSDLDANKNRSKTLLELYSKFVDKNNETTHMVKLPELPALIKKNPFCYENSKVCFDSKYGCRRRTYSQVCELCKPGDFGCEIKKPGDTFPTLTKASRSVTDAQLRSTPTYKRNVDVTNAGAACSWSQIAMATWLLAAAAWME